MYRSFLRSILIGLMLIGISGCHRLFLPPAVQPDPQASAEELDYRQAITLYHQGEYAAAEHYFQTLYHSTNDPDLQRRTLYGLACSKLMIAETSRDYQAGLMLWYEWVSCASREVNHETPLLMVPLIREKAFFGSIPLTGPISSEIQETGIVPSWKLEKVSQEVENLKQQLEESDRQKKAAQKKISALEKEIAELQNQIKALETIDQKIQKKKSAIPSAN